MAFPAKNWLFKKESGLCAISFTIFRANRSRCTTIQSIGPERGEAFFLKFTFFLREICHHTHMRISQVSIVMLFLLWTLPALCARTLYVPFNHTNSAWFSSSGWTLQVSIHCNISNPTTVPQPVTITPQKAGTLVNDTVASDQGTMTVHTFTLNENETYPLTWFTGSIAPGTGPGTFGDNLPRFIKIDVVEDNGFLIGECMANRFGYLTTSQTFSDSVRIPINEGKPF